MRRERLQEKRHCARDATLFLSLLWMQFHNDAPARQAARDESSGAVALRHGQHEFLFDRPPPRRQRRHRSHLDRNEARKLPEPAIKAEQVIITLDEMWHFLQKLANSGFGGPTTLWLGEPSPGLLVIVMTPHAKNSSTRSASRARRSSPTIGTATIASSPRLSSSPARIRPFPSSRTTATSAISWRAFAAAQRSSPRARKWSTCPSGYTIICMTISKTSPQNSLFSSLSLVRTLRHRRSAPREAAVGSELASAAGARSRR